MEDTRAFGIITKELEGRNKDIPTFAERLAEHTNRLTALNSRLLEDDYNQDQADLEQDIVKIYTACITIKTLGDNGFTEILGNWVRL